MLVNCLKRSLPTSACRRRGWAKLKPELQKLVDLGQIPGGVAAVARHGKLAYLTTFGYSDLASKTPMAEDTIFAIASMTKPITCTAAMILVDEGKLGLDDPLSKFIPELKDLRVLGNAKDDTESEVCHRHGEAANQDPRPAVAHFRIRLRRDPFVQRPAGPEL